MKVTWEENVAPQVYHFRKKRVYEINLYKDPHRNLKREFKRNLFQLIPQFGYEIYYLLGIRDEASPASNCKDTRKNLYRTQGVKRIPGRT